MSCSSFKSSIKYWINWKPFKNALIVDDVYETGITLTRFKNIEGAIFFVLVSKTKPIWWNAVNFSNKKEWILFPWENKKNEIQKVSDREAEEAFIKILEWMGEDPGREGLLETPKRVVKAFKEYFKGYTQDPRKELEKTFGDVDGYDDMVIQKNISVQSHCEHHMAPIIGVAHVAYIPRERVVGLSKLARVVEIYSKRLQTQERLNMQIAKTLMEVLDAKGVAVSIDSTHQCMTMRGIKKEQATTVTNYFLGEFKEDLSIQNRYLRFIAK